MEIALKHQSELQFLKRLQKRLKEERDPVKGCKIASRLWQRHLEGGVTKAQMQEIFNLDTQAEWNVFVTRMTRLSSIWLELSEANKL